MVPVGHRTIPDHTQRQDTGTNQGSAQHEFQKHVPPRRQPSRIAHLPNDHMVERETEALHVCMYTPNSGGGHAKYSQHILEAIARMCKEEKIHVVFVTSEQLEEEYWSDGYTQYKIIPSDPAPTELRSLMPRGLVTLAVRFLADRVFVSWLNSHSEIRLVHFQEYTPWLASFRFRRLESQGYTVLCTVHNVFPHWYPWFAPKQIYDTWRRRAWLSCELLFVHSLAAKEQLQSFLGAGCPLVEVLPHGLFYRLDEQEVRALASSRLGKKQLLFFGVLRPNKGIEYLLEAMASLTGFRLTIAGEPVSRAYQKKLRELIRETCADRVELVDRHIEEAEIKPLFREATLVMLPYTSFSSQSGVLHMALGLGVPVVASDVGGLGETVSFHRAGRVVSPRDARGLAEAVSSLCQEATYSQSVEGILRARASTSWETAAAATLRGYRLAYERKQLRLQNRH